MKLFSNDLKNKEEKKRFNNQDLNIMFQEIHDGVLGWITGESFCSLMLLAIYVSRDIKDWIY